MMFLVPLRRGLRISSAVMTTEIRVTHEDDALPPAELLRRINV